MSEKKSTSKFLKFLHAKWTISIGSILITSLILYIFKSVRVYLGDFFNFVISLWVPYWIVIAILLIYYFVVKKIDNANMKTKSNTTLTESPTKYSKYVDQKGLVWRYENSLPFGLIVKGPFCGVCDFELVVGTVSAKGKGEWYEYYCNDCESYVALYSKEDNSKTKKYIEREMRKET